MSKRKAKAKPRARTVRPPRKRKPKGPVKLSKAEKEALAKRTREPIPPPVVEQEQSTPAITSPEIIRSRLDLVEGDLAALRVSLEEILDRSKHVLPDSIVGEVKDFRYIADQLVSYLDPEHLEACRICGCTPLFYVMQLIDIKKKAIFDHPKWVLISKPNPKLEENEKYELGPR